MQILRLQKKGDEDSLAARDFYCDIDIFLPVAMAGKARHRAFAR